MVTIFLSAESTAELEPRIVELVGGWSFLIVIIIMQI